MADFELTPPLHPPLKRGQRAGWPRGIPAHNRKNRIGQRFGRLTVIAAAGQRHNSAAWLCECDCGTQKIVGADGLRSGTKSCGCSRKTGKDSRPRYRSKHQPGAAAQRNLLKSYKSAAEKRGLLWELTPEQFFTATQQSCAYCGLEPSRIRRISRNGGYTWNGIDRIDNTQGYRLDNIVTCCSTCNHAKCDMTQDEFLQWIRRLINHNC